MPWGCCKRAAPAVQQKALFSIPKPACVSGVWVLTIMKKWENPNTRKSLVHDEIISQKLKHIWSSPISKCEVMWYFCCVWFYSWRRINNNKVKKRNQSPQTELMHHPLFSKAQNEFSLQSLPHLQMHLLFLSLLMW